MKKIFKITISLLACIVLFAIAKFSLFRDADINFYEEGWLPMKTNNMT